MAILTSTLKPAIHTVGMTALTVQSMTRTFHVYLLVFEATISPCNDLGVCGYLLDPLNHSHGANKAMKTCSNTVLLNHM